MTEVKPGQIWADNDWRSKGRTVRVLEVGAVRVDVEVLTAVGGEVLAKPRRVRIRRDRFKPTSTGYRLLTEDPETSPRTPERSG